MIWENVLVEWANCLKLSEPIKTLTDLKDGHFICSLSKHIIPSKTDTKDTYLDDIFQLLKRNYPLITIDKESYENLAECSTSNVILLLSILMHYSCILDRQDVLTSPLCLRLSRKTQLYIKTFLEKMENDITNDYIFKIIEEIIFLKSPLPCTTIGDSSSMGSPLHKLLETPAKHTRLHEIDCEIKKLRSELQTERYERSEIEEELDIQQSKNQSLVKRVEEKTAEIIRLRNELAELQFQTPLNVLDVDTQELQRRLRSDIRNLEKYIAQLEVEKEKLQDENDVIRKRLKKAETQCTLWQEQALTSERNSENLSETVHQCNVELKNLYAHCSEITALLEELQNKSINDSCGELDSAQDLRVSRNNTLLAEEDLAHAVVEVQLRDVQKENVELKDFLMNLQDSHDKLNAQLEQFQIDYEDLTKQYDSLQNGNADLLEKVSILTVSEAALVETRNQLLQITQKNVEVSQEKGQLEAELSTLKSDYCSTIKTLKTSEALNMTISNDIKILQEQYESLQLDLRDRNEEYDKLQTLGEKTQHELDKLLKKYDVSSMHLQSLKLNFTKLNASMENGLKKLEHIVHGNNETCIESSDMDLAFGHILKRLEENIVCDINEKKFLNQQNSDFQTMVDALKCEIQVINERETLSLQGKQKLENSLHNLEQKMSILENANVSYIQKIKSLHITIEEMSVTISELEKLKKEVKTKTEVIGELQSSKGSLENQLSLADDELIKFKLGEEKLLQMLSTLETGKYGVETKLSEAGYELSQSRKSEEHLKRTIDDLMLAKSNLESKLSKSKLENSDHVAVQEQLNRDLMKMQLGKEKLEQELVEKNKVLLCHKENEERLQQILQDLENRKYFLEEELNKTRDEVMQLKASEENMQKIVIDKEKSSLEAISVLNFKISDYHTQVIALKSELEYLKIEKLNVLEELDAVNKTNLLIKETFGSYKFENEKRVTILTATIENLNEAIGQLTTENAELNENNNLCSKVNALIGVEKQKLAGRIKELQNEIQILQGLKSEAEKKSSDLEANISKIVEELAIKSDELKNAINQLNEYQSRTTQEIENIKLSLLENNTKLENLTMERNSLLAEHKTHVDALTKDLAEKSFEVNLLGNKEIQQMEEIRQLQDELSQTIDKYTEALQLQQETKLENETQINNLTENLHSIVEKYNNLDKVHAVLLSEMQQACENRETLETAKIELEVKLLAQWRQFQDEYHKSKTEFVEEIATLTNNIGHLTAELGESCGAQSVLKDTVDVLQKEKLQLEESLQKLEANFGETTKEFAAFKISHSSYVQENEKNFVEVRAELVELIDKLTKEKDTLDADVLAHDEEVCKLRSENAALVDAHQREISQQQFETCGLEESSKNLVQKLERTSLEQKQLKEQIFYEREKFNDLKNILDESLAEHKTKLQENEVLLTKLQCAYDILETGKNLLQKDLDGIVIELKVLEGTKQMEENKFLETLSKKESLIGKTESEVEYLRGLVKENVKKNGELCAELETVTKALDAEKRKNEILDKILLEEQEKRVAEGKQHESHVNELLVQYHHLYGKMVDLELKHEGLKNEERVTDLAKTALEGEIAEKKLLVEKLYKDVCTQSTEIDKLKGEIAEANSRFQKKLDEISELQSCKLALTNTVRSVSNELEEINRQRDELLDSQTKIIKESENNVIRAHESAIEVKNDFLKRLELIEQEKLNEKQLRIDVETLLKGEKKAKEILEIRILELTNEKAKMTNLYLELVAGIENLREILAEKPIEISIISKEFSEVDVKSMEDLSVIIHKIREEIVDIIGKKSQLDEQIANLKLEKLEKTQIIAELTDERRIFSEERAKLAMDLHTLEEIQTEHDTLRAKYEQALLKESAKEELEMKNVELQDLVKKLTETNMHVKTFADYSKIYITKIEKLVVERNTLESLVNTLRQTLMSVQSKSAQITEESNRKLFEQKQSIEIISEDIQKQFSKISRNVYEMIFNTMIVCEKVLVDVTSGDPTASETLFKQLIVDDALEKLMDFKQEVADVLQQANNLENVLDPKSKGPGRVLKENLSRNVSKTNANVHNTDLKAKEEELRKKNLFLKQKLTLSENAKNNLERKVKQLREDNKALVEKSTLMDADMHYKTLLQEHIRTKDANEKLLHEHLVQYNNLTREFETYKAEVNFVPAQIKYEKEQKTVQDFKLENELLKLREAYGKVMSESSKLNLENATMRKLLEERTSQLSDLAVVKEAYEKLLEENNKLRTEVDTLKFKRGRDRDEYVRLLEKDKEQRESKECRRIQEVRNEYEGKLEKMKEQMVKLYREEMDKEMQKMLSEKKENAYLLNTINKLKQELKNARYETKQNVVRLQRLADRDLDIYSSRESLRSLPVKDEPVPEKDTLKNSITSKRGATVDEISSAERLKIAQRKKVEDRKYPTLPKSAMDIIEEATISHHGMVNHPIPQVIGQNIQMEDEGDLFNTKYLTDMKAGRCTLPTGRESNVRRMSELQWRNSLCPPHLKSSYPAETQFTSPGEFKDEELKAGVVDLDDSMSTQLLPGEKPRKKDIGTTSYKRPGPPTPSKNGGRISLQGNEIHPRDVLREHNELKTPKRTTPSRIKALFMGRNTSVKENSENQPTTPRSKRLSIFRKPR